MDSLFPVEQKIYAKVCKCVRGLYGRTELSNRAWTNELKNALYALCEKCRFQAWGTGATYGEWLWDVAWIKLGGNNWQNFRGVYLACEIEWGRSLDALLEDFLKLVAAKSDYRLFIFEARNMRHAEASFSLLMNACPASEGARYMGIAVMEGAEGGNLPYRAWTL